MEYGYFDNPRKEYVITRPDTPLPWINYLGADEYCALFSNTAGGYSFYQDARTQRITRYRYNNVPMDRGGRYIYIKDTASKDFWSASWQPVLKDLKNYQYECRHGLGYSVIKSNYQDIATETTYLVPKNENLEIWCCVISNQSPRERTLEVYPFIEFCLYDALNDMTDYQYNLNIGSTEYDPETSTIYHTTEHNIKRDIFTYMTVNQRASGFDSQRSEFLGRYGDFSAPRAILESKCNNSLAIGWSPVGAFKLDVTLKAGESKTVIVTLGVAKQRGSETPLLNKYRSKTDVDAALTTLKTYWDENLAKFQTETPDDQVNTMINIWNQYQCRTTFNWSRSASYYESGIGRGMGFRDSCQDTLGFGHMIPTEVRQRIFDIASTQFQRGDAHHQYSPLTKKGDGSNFSDDHLWLILAVAQYLKESGDYEFLKEYVPYDCGEGGSGPLYEHLEAAIEFTHNHLGPHGFPLMLNADWNDCLNLWGSQKNSESVWVAMQFVLCCQEMQSIARLSGNKADIEKYRRYEEDMKKTINAVAWDGKWYVRAFTDKKEVVGSSRNAEGKIFLLPQAWAVIANIGTRQQQIQAMDSVYEHLYTEHGIMLLSPSYGSFNPDIGAVTMYPRGLKENGAIFCHPNPWAMLAEALLGRGENAFKYYKAILPSSKNKIADLRKTEPYVYCQMIAGRDHKEFGEGKNSWLTGTAAWNCFAGTSYVLGVRASYEGLVVSPAIPAEWKEYHVTRVFRGATYHIHIKNPLGASSGVSELKVNGASVKGNVIPLQVPGSTVNVEVQLGSKVPVAVS